MKKIFFRTFVCLSIVWSLTSIAFAGSGQGHEYGLVKHELQVYFDRLAEENAFSGSVLIAKQGKVLLKEGYGKADYEKNKRNNPSTIFSIASLGKAFTSMSIMILEERGLLSVNDTIADHIPEFPHGDLITIHQLLSHSSGLYLMVDNPLMIENSANYHTPEQVLEYFMYEPLRFEPGTQWEYCNSGFVTLGVIIERASGMNYRDFIKTNIFEPLGMIHTGYDPDDVEFLNKRATGYDDILSDPPVESFHIHPTVIFSAGAHYSTVKDMYKWDQALYTEQLVSAETLERIFTPNLGGYGYGWYSDNLEIDGEVHKHIWHWGDYPGFHSFFSRLVDDNVTIIILSNTSGATHTPDDLGLIAKQAAAIIFENE